MPDASQISRRIKLRQLNVFVAVVEYGSMAKAAEHLREMRELTRFHISHPKLSNKTKPGSKFPIEPEVAAAVECMQTWRGYERQTEIVAAGLRAAHADRPAARLPAVQRAWRFLRKLAERFVRLSWRPVAVTAASGALVGCLVLLGGGAARPGPLVVVLPGAGPDGSTVSFDPGAILATPAAWGEKPLDQPIPVKTLPGQKVAPCDAGLSEEAINGNCWAWMGGEPPCGRLFRQGNKCYLPVAADPKKPVGPPPDAP
jgi:hypothetical protein